MAAIQPSTFSPMTVSVLAGRLTLSIRPRKVNAFFSAGFAGTGVTPIRCR